MNRLTTLTPKVTRRELTRGEIHALLMMRIGGYSAKCIAANTHLTKSQIDRLKKNFNIRLRDWRDGETQQAQQMISLTKETSAHYLEDIRNAIKQLPARFAEQSTTKI